MDSVGLVWRALSVATKAHALYDNLDPEMWLNWPEFGAELQEPAKPILLLLIGASLEAPLEPSHELT